MVCTRSDEFFKVCHEVEKVCPDGIPNQLALCLQWIAWIPHPGEWTTLSAPVNSSRSMNLLFISNWMWKMLTKGSWNLLQCRYRQRNSESCLQVRAWKLAFPMFRNVLTIACGWKIAWYVGSGASFVLIWLIPVCTNTFMNDWCNHSTQSLLYPFFALWPFLFFFLSQSWSKPKL